VEKSIPHTTKNKSIVAKAVQGKGKAIHGKNITVLFVEVRAKDTGLHAEK